jgi:uncharacterized protein
MLALDVATLREGTARLDRHIPPDAMIREEDYRVLEPVILDATVSRSKAKVGIAGQATTTLELSCSRCLEGFAVPVTANFDLTYLPSGEAPVGGGEAEVADEDINTAYYQGGQIDLADLIHEQLYLVLPMKPLCRDDCQGLCPMCGANRNTTACTCEATWTDPRLAGLKALLNETDDA